MDGGRLPQTLPFHQEEGPSKQGFSGTSILVHPSEAGRPADSLWRAAAAPAGGRATQQQHQTRGHPWDPRAHVYTPQRGCSQGCFAAFKTELSPLLPALQKRCTVLLAGGRELSSPWACREEGKQKSRVANRGAPAYQDDSGLKKFLPLRKFLLSLGNCACKRQIMLQSLHHPSGLVQSK